MYVLGLDLGSSSIKASILDVNSGKCAGSASYPAEEMNIIVKHPGWAEQEPEEWWRNAILATQKALSVANIPAHEIAAIGVAYQMHGLVVVDHDLRPLRPSIIWCDSRAVSDGNRLYAKTGEQKCLKRLLNSPGNFTLSKLHWLKTNEPETFERIYKMMLPGDYLAMRMTGVVNTTVSGLSEAVVWDFQENRIADFLLESAGIPYDLIADIVPTFGLQGKLSKAASRESGLPAGIPVAYRSGDQPNNAFSLNVLEPGEIAANAGTSGVVYGVTGQLESDPLSRVNTFAHVNHSMELPRLGLLLCINGTGIANSWIRKITGSSGFEEMNQDARNISPGSEGLICLPFGNGSERMLEQQDAGASFHRLNFNIHQKKHLFRAVQEGVAFAFHYGINIMKASGMAAKSIRAGYTNMFLSDVFCSTLAAITGLSIELYNTDGSLGAARGAAVGAGFYPEIKDAFKSLDCLKTFHPDVDLKNIIQDNYLEWEHLLINR